jgi:hypothetical protein
MSDKNDNVIIKNEINNKNTNDIVMLIKKKVDFFKYVIQKTIIHVQKNKILDILGISDLNTCVDKLNEVNEKIKKIINSLTANANTDMLVSNLQSINNDMSCVLKNYGTDVLEDLLLICFGNTNQIIHNENEALKFEILKKYFHPISYKVITKKDDVKSKKYNEILDDSYNNLDCFEVSSSFKQFYMKAYGIKVYISSSSLKKSIIVYGIVDDVIIDFLNNEYIFLKQSQIKSNIPSDSNFNADMFNIFINSLTLKDYLIHNNVTEYYNKFAGCVCKINTLKQKQMPCLIKEFINDDMYSKRNSLITLLIGSNSYENQYLAYLLYDLISNDNSGKIDTQEQTILFDSFPWQIKKYFKQAMKKTIQYTNELSNFDMNKIPLEQQICLLKASDSVKEKAMMKLKEVKAKSEDTGSKARQYLEGLLKIPFNIYKCEPILTKMKTVKSQFKEMYAKYNIGIKIPEILNKEKYTNIEILKYLTKIKNSIFNDTENINKIEKHLLTGEKKILTNNIVLINKLLTAHCFTEKIINYNELNKVNMKSEIKKFVDFCKIDTNYGLLKDTITQFMEESKLSLSLYNEVTDLEKNINQLTVYMNDVKNILNKSVHGHNNAKQQIERIIGQWVNSDTNDNTGYVLGFEGNPGIGKTTLAKGLSECLKDEQNLPRPFALIAIGGDSNSSSLVGHSYTYVGSTWGQIVQILIDKKCMNPIILIDEVDKISKTEQGREIIGILTHLLDPTQNANFQDKYFSGIDLDLSKVLFILSYNDVDSIDRIMLDRVHRIKFNSLTVEDKITICNKHLLPEIYKNIGLEDMIYFSDDVLKFIIEEYTLEPGVRKLKEKLFEIVGEINLKILKTPDCSFNLPINITVDEIKSKYLKDMREIKIQKIHNENKVGVINCLWANVYSVGGILSASAKFMPSEYFLNLKLTGMIDQMMQESFQISLTLAYNLLSEERKKEIDEMYNGKNKYGIHLHMGDGSVNKSGTSAGIAITILMYSLLNDKKIKRDFAVTGEACDLNGKVGEIGALDTKIIYGIKSGVKNFIYPLENQQDFNKFIEKYKDAELIKNINFYPVTDVNEAIDLIIEK